MNLLTEKFVEEHNKLHRHVPIIKMIEKYIWIILFGGVWMKEKRFWSLMQQNRPCRNSESARSDFTTTKKT